MSDTPKIIQLLMCRNDNVWQGVLLGLGDDGVTYHCQGGTWQPCIPKLALQDKTIELAKVTNQRDELLEALDKLLDKVTDIRGIDIELYAPVETEAAKQVIKKIKEKIL